MEEKTMLSQGEWRIMNLLWKKKNRTIMEAKGVVAYETVGRAKHYYPVGKQADFVQQETKSFLDRVYRGSFGEMLTTMVKQEQLSEQDLKQLRQLLEETEEKG